MKIIAHRGYWRSKRTAQNSLNAVLKAIEGKFHGIEVDIRMSKDLVLYLCHDSSIKGHVIHKTHSSILDQLELSSGEKITRFDDFIKIVTKTPELTLFLEIKSIKSNKYRQIITQKLIAHLRSNNLIQNSVLLCFDIRILKHAGFIEPKLSRMILIENLNFNFYKIEHQKIDVIGFRHQLILKQPELIAQSKALGFETNAWTVNKLKSAEKIAKLPISSITTDIPNVLLEMASSTTQTCAVQDPASLKSP